MTRRVVVTGSSGLIGRALVPALLAAGYEPLRLVRREPAAPDESRWRPDVGAVDMRAFDGAAAVVHLAGASIGARRWSAAHKDEIVASRERGTARIARAVARSGVPVLLSASAIGYYGDRGDEVLTEASGPGTGFRAHVCRRWEHAVQPASDAGARVALLRSGIVLSADGGILPFLAAPFRAGVGGPLGPGTQWVPWISIDDEARAIVHLLRSDVRGAVNLVSPHPVTNGDLARAIGRALRRPSRLRVPARVLEALAGRERAREVLLSSQRAMPEVLLGSGFDFAHPDIDTALRSVLSSAT